MGRMTTMSPLGLYRWDETIFDLMQIPSALDKPTLIDNLLAETAELEVLYPNPVVFKNLVGVWSAKQIDIWNRLYATTQYEYNPLENYNRYETGSEDGAGRTTHSGTDTTAETTQYSGTDGRTEAITHGGRDTTTESKREGGTQTDNTSVEMEQGGTEQLAINKREGGTETEATTGHVEQGGSDTVTGEDTKGHWVAGFDSQASGQSDGLVKQTRDQDDATTTTDYGKEEDSTGSKTTTFGKTETNSETTTFGKTEETTKQETIGFGKTENNTEELAYGKTENTTEQKTYGQTIGKQGSMTHGEQVATTSEGSHELHAHGNIGVTTTQKLIREQRDVELFNLYDIIIEDFKMRFCILIY